MSVERAHACWDHLINKYSWNHSTAFRIMYCESTGNWQATNGKHHGLFQIANGPYDPESNVALAYSMYKDAGGWSDWDYGCL